jgi:sarcosine oxidase gamma subunit
VGEIEVCVYDHGGADINWTISDETGSLIPVAKSDRAAVALALLGGITDELVEQLARTLANEFWIISPDEWDLLDPEDHANMRQRAGRLLAAIVGGGEGES